MSKARKLEAAEEDDIVASGEALRTVAGWLGVADVGEVMEQEGLNPEFEAGRTQGLGLGAKFLPHHKAVALTAGVEHRLSSKLKRTAERQAAAGFGGGGGGHQHPGAAKHMALLQHGRHHMGAQRPQDKATQQQQRQPQEEEEDSEEEEEGRGRAFGKGKGRQAAQRPPTYSRAELLAAPAAAPRGKKRKRNKGGGSSGGGAAAS